MEIVVVFFEFVGPWTFNNGQERERELASPQTNSQRGIFIEKIRVGKDLVRTGRISDQSNPQSWPFGCPVFLLLKSLHPDVRSE